jgi:hypothetical protein
VPTVEEVAGHWAEINDQDGYYVPENLYDWSSKFMSHLGR